MSAPTPTKGYRPFNPVVVVDRVLGDKPAKGLQIESIDVYDGNLYLGTSDGFVLYYVIERVLSATNADAYQTKLEVKKSLGPKKPVERLLVIARARKVVALVDSTFIVLGATTLSLEYGGAGLIKGVTCFCHDQRNRDGDPLLCVFRKKSFQQYHVGQDKLLAVGREHSVADVVVAARRYEDTICAAYPRQYVLFSAESGHQTDLFPFDGHSTIPLIVLVGPNEFLLSVATSETDVLGMFVSSKGITTRPPLRWSSCPRSAVCRAPFAIGTVGDAVEVHSMIDQRVKQQIPFKSVRQICAGDGGVPLVAGGNKVCAVTMVPAKDQCIELIAEGRVQEALDLGDSLLSRPRSSDDPAQLARDLRVVRQHAGFALLSQGGASIAQATEIFDKSQLDPREFIALFPELLPTGTSFVPVLAPGARESVARVPVKEIKEALYAYLVSARNNPRVSDGKREEVDTAILKLAADGYGDVSPVALVALASQKDSNAAPDCEEYLQLRGRHGALAAFCLSRGNARKALELWMRLAEGQLTDAEEGVDWVARIADCLSSLDRSELVWKYAEWVLRKDVQKGISIFTSRPSSEPPGLYSPESVLEYLEPFGREAVERYLEFLIAQGSTDEAHHTRLAMLYLDDLQKKRDLTGGHGRERQTLGENSPRMKLLRLLETSAHYKVAAVLARIRDSDLYEECAVLYGKMGEHERALQLLVHRLGDHAAAERYCFVARTEKATPKALLVLLLKIYLTPSGTGEVKLDRVTDLVNRHAQDIDAIKVLELLPADTPLAEIERFLSVAIRVSVHKQRDTLVVRNLHRAQYLRARAEYAQVSSRPVIITEDTTCFVCGRHFGDGAVFARTPAGAIAHPHCVRDRDRLGDSADKHRGSVFAQHAGSKGATARYAASIEDEISRPAQRWQRSNVL